MRNIQIFICMFFFGLAGTGVAQTTLSGGISSAWKNTATISTTGGQTLTLGLGVEYLIVCLLYTSDAADE